jgi:hypothetical protein
VIRLENFVFLDVNGSIKVKTPGYEMNIVKDDIISDLRSARVKVALNEGGDIKWKASYFIWPWMITAGTIYMMEGKLHFKSMADGGIEVLYYASLRYFQVVCLMFLLIILLLYIVAEMPVEMVFILIGILSLAYMIHRFWVKSWLKGFIKRHIHSVD